MSAEDKVFTSAQIAAWNKLWDFLLTPGIAEPDLTEVQVNSGTVATHTAEELTPSKYIAAEDR
jgi:hypothetical protein